MATKITDRQKFDTLQARIGAAQREYDTMRVDLVVKYGDLAYATRTARAQLDRLSARVDRYGNKLYALLDRVSPRDWRSGVPVSHVHARLTWYDATTRAALSVVPPAAYGYTDAQMRAFAAALSTHDRPLASPGMTSYRYRGPFGWIMIGARDTGDALREAARSTDGAIDAARLEIWTGVRYAPVAPATAPACLSSDHIGAR